MRAVTFIKHSVIDMNKRLRALEAPATGGTRGSENETVVLNTVLGSYPIATHIQLLEEEKKLLDGAYKQQLVIIEFHFPFSCWMSQFNVLIMMFFTNFLYRLLN